jgi:hypothetical protein
VDASVPGVAFGSANGRLTLWCYYYYYDYYYYYYYYCFFA